MGSYVIYRCQNCGKSCTKSSPIECLYCSKLLCWSCQKSKFCPEHYQKLTPQERSKLLSTHRLWGFIDILAYIGAFVGFMFMVGFFATQAYWQGALAVAVMVLLCYGSCKVPGVGQKKKSEVKRQISERLGDKGPDRFVKVPVGGGKSIVADRDVLNAMIAKSKKLPSQPSNVPAQPSNMPLQDPTPQEIPEIIPRPLTTDTISSQVKICASCGKENGTTNVFCIGCGEKLT